MRAPGAVEELARLQANGTQLEPLLRLLLPAIMRTLAAPERTAAAALLRELVSGLDLRPHARTLTEQLLGVIGRAGDAPEPEFLANLQQTLRFAIGVTKAPLSAGFKPLVGEPCWPLATRSGVVWCCHVNSVSEVSSDLDCYPDFAPAVCRTLTLRHPQQADAAVNVTLAELRRSAEPQRPSNRALKRAREQAVKAGTAPDGSADAAGAAAPDEASAPDPAREQAARVLAALQGALQGSASAPVPEAGSTLLLAVDAPAAEVRALVSFTRHVI